MYSIWNYQLKYVRINLVNFQIWNLFNLGLINNTPLNVIWLLARITQWQKWALRSVNLNTEINNCYRIQYRRNFDRNFKISDRGKRLIQPPLSSRSTAVFTIRCECTKRLKINRTKRWAKLSCGNWFYKKIKIYRWKCNYTNFIRQKRKVWSY